MGGAQGPNAGKDATAVMRLRQIILLIGTARPRSSLRAARSMKLSGVRPSVRRLSQSHNRQQQRWPAGLLFSAMRAKYISGGLRRRVPTGGMLNNNGVAVRRKAANAGSVMLTAAVRG